MKTDIKTKWIDALESDEYSQTQKTLKDEKGHCCLGVLCDLYHKETGEGGWDKRHRFITEEMEWDEFEDFEIPKLEDGELPVEVQEWAGLDSALGVFYPEDADSKEESLAVLNDSGMNFKQIAQTIKINF